MRFLRFFIAALVVLLPLTGAFAQPVGDDAVQRIDGLRRDVERIATNIEGVEDDARLVALSEQLVAIRTQLIQAGVQLSPRLEEIKTRLDQIGPPPAEGEPAEPAALSAERTALAEERARINQLLGTLEEQSISAKTLTDRIAETRRTLFTDQLSRSYDLTDAFDTELITDLSERWQVLERRVTSWVTFTWRTKSTEMLAGVALVLLVALGAFYFFRRTVKVWIRRDSQHDAPGSFARLTTAFWYVLLPTIVTWISLGVAVAALNHMVVLRADILRLLATVIVCIAVISLVWRLSEAVFSPGLPNWRLIPLTDRAARALKFIVIAMAVVVIVDIAITEINGIVGTSLAVTIARSLISSIAIGLLLLSAGFLRPFGAEPDASGGTAAAEAAAEPAATAANVVTTGTAPWPPYVRWPLLIAGFTIIAAALLGFIGFALFAAQQIVITGAVMATMYLGYLASKAIAGEDAFASTGLGRWLEKRYGWGEAALDQAGLAAGLLLGLTMLFFGLPLIAMLWGFQWTEIRSFSWQVFTDIQVGSIRVSIAAILIGIALFMAGLWATRRFQAWLDGSVLQRGRVEAGARNSIRKALGYVGIAIAALIGVSAAGVDLSQLALVAGALSLGIGLGLQNIASNFVSGLILLAERPFKAGDIIDAGGYSGTVKSVNVRATEIETFDRKTLILPNSELINSAVSNWMHKSTQGRVMIPVGVAYDSDPKQVRDLLLEIAEDHPRVQANPAPLVSFENFGASSLDFILYCYLADIGFGLAVRTELRIAIFERFKAAGIEFPFPQTDVNIKVTRGEMRDVMRAAKPEGAFDVIETSKRRTLEDD